MDKVVGAIIVNDAGEFLLQLRDEQATDEPLKWTLFGGALEAGETAEAALWRELAEELALGKEWILRYELVQVNVQANGTQQSIFYVQTVARLEDLILREGKAVVYVPQRALFERLFAFNIEQVLQDYLSGRGENMES